MGYRGLRLLSVAAGVLGVSAALFFLPHSTAKTIERSPFGGNPQPAIIATTDENDRVIVFSDATNLPAPGQTPVPGLPIGAKPHGVGYFGADNALITDWGGGRVFLVQASTATLATAIKRATLSFGGLRRVSGSIEEART